MRSPRRAPISYTLWQKPEIMHSTPLWGGNSTSRPQTWKTSNQESQTPYFPLLPPALQGPKHHTFSYNSTIISNRKLPTESTNTLSWTSWPFKMTLIGCPQPSVENYHSVLHNIPEERRSHQQIWWYTTDLLYPIFISMMVIWLGQNM
jgi:hypothetical protein